MAEYVDAWIALLMAYDEAAVALFTLSFFVLLVNVGRSLLGGR